MPAYSCEVLVIHPGALGDVLQAVPALRALRTASGRLAFAGQRHLARFLEGAGLADEALDFDALGLEALFASEPVPSEVRGRLARFDGVVSWFGSRAEPFPERLRSLVPRALLAPPVPDTVAGAGPPPAVWEHLLATLAPWGVEPPSLEPLELPGAWMEEAGRRLGDLGIAAGQRLLVVQPGAGAVWKRWAPEGFGSVIRRAVSATGCRVLVHQGPADGPAVEALLDGLDLPLARLVEPGLPLLAAVLAGAAAFLGGDTGVSHLAAAVGAPAVILFPPATRQRWAPWSASARPLTLGGDRSDIEAAGRAVVECLRGRPQSRG